MSQFQSHVIDLGRISQQPECAPEWFSFTPKWSENRVESSRDRITQGTVPNYLLPQLASEPFKVELHS